MTAEHSDEAAVPDDGKGPVRLGKEHLGCRDDLGLGPDGLDRAAHLVAYRSSPLLVVARLQRRTKAVLLRQDADQLGLADQREGSPVPYASWTPRLLKAAYNWKFVGADTGIHVHNPHYALQLLYDSAEDLSAALGRELQGMAR